MEKHVQVNWIKTLTELKLDKTPALVVDLNIIRSNLKRFRRVLPRVKIHYAVKALSDECVLKIIDEYVDGYDIASYGELKTIRKISDKKVLFSNPVKIPAHVKSSHKEGVDSFAFDSAMELHKIAENAPGSDVYLRLKVSDYGSAFPLSKKFGADENHTVPLFGYAKDLGLNPIGITFHVGSQSENTATWENAIEKSGKLIKQLSKAGFKISMLNIGGGFPSEYSDETVTISDVAPVINKALEKNIPTNVEIVAEPGRYVVANAAVMVSTVIGKENRSGQNWLYLDIGVFQGLMESLEMDDWKYPVFKLEENDNKAMPHHYVLTGPTCDAQDTIDLDVELPADIKLGDTICIGSAGAYSVVYGSSFNGFDMPSVVCINKEAM